MARNIGKTMQERYGIEVDATRIYPRLRTNCFRLYANGRTNHWKVSIIQVSKRATAGSKKNCI